MTIVPIWITIILWKNFNHWINLEVFFLIYMLLACLFQTRSFLFQKLFNFSYRCVTFCTNDPMTNVAAQVKGSHFTSKLTLWSWFQRFIGAWRLLCPWFGSAGTPCHRLLLFFLQANTERQITVCQAALPSYKVPTRNSRVMFSAF